MSQIIPRRPAWAIALLWAMILAYTVYFSAVSIRLHDAQRTHASDLGQIDQAIWNTAHGRWVEQTRDDYLSTRMTDHVEPIFAPVSLVFLGWDDVRALLILQSLLLALGAWPVFDIAFERLAQTPAGKARAPAGTVEATSGQPGSRSLAVAALVFAAAYLLYPALQAANAAEFHALPLATPIILFALLFAMRRNWGRFAIAALLVAAVQEGTALLGALLGLYALASGALQWRRDRRAGRSTAVIWRPLAAGGLVLAASLAWFYAATFVIIPAHAAQAYGLDESPYVARYGELGSSFNDVLVSIVTRPGLVVQVGAEPLRLRYLFVLLATLGFLSLAGPEFLLLAAPLLLANLLSAFPFQYSGQLHYSAPLAAYVVVAAVAGGQRLRGLGRLAAVGLHNHRLWRAHRRLLPLIVWVLLWSIGCQIAFGFTPAGRNFQYYWSSPTAHDRLLARFAGQIPPDAPLSTVASLHPHFSHRQFLYRFPIVADSQFVLLDLAAESGWSMHPQEMRQEVDGLLATGEWTVQDGADGYLLLRRIEPGVEQPVTVLPEAFYSFAQASQTPQHPVDITFGDKLRLVGYDIVDDEEWRQTGLRLYWQALQPLPDDLQLYVSAVSADGESADNTELRPLIQPFWYPPSHWPTGETVVTTKLPWSLPKVWALGVGAFQGATWDTGARWTVSEGNGAPEYENGTLALAGAWQRASGKLVPAVEPQASETVVEHFGGDGWNVELKGLTMPERAAPGQTIPVTLQWQADGPAPRDYNIFVHVLNSQGQKVAQSDSPPIYFGQHPTSQWQAGETMTTAHSIQLPENLPPGHYDVIVGWYYWETLERLGHMTESGELAGDAPVIGRLAVDPTAGPAPDLACAVVPETCASQ